MSNKSELAFLKTRSGGVEKGGVAMEVCLVLHPS